MDAMTEEKKASRMNLFELYTSTKGKVDAETLNRPSADIRSPFLVINGHCTNVSHSRTLLPFTHVWSRTRSKTHRQSSVPGKQRQALTPIIMASTRTCDIPGEARRVFQ